ncbi:hypothetical protein CMO90_02740 [Candidatus Woesearchaeota archaeon]|nr:hypothetical protein [Candidatus Woesearchaeota archaeon]
MVLARLKIDEYTNRVLNTLKAKFDLKNKSEALNKFADIYGDELVEKQASDKYIRKAINVSAQHIKKHSDKKMSLKELDKLCEAD